jgi:beta-glucosidase
VAGRRALVADGPLPVHARSEDPRLIDIAATTVKTRFVFICAIIPFASPVVATAHAEAPVRISATAGVDHSIDSILARLTLDEKVGQLVQVTGRWDRTRSEATVTDGQRALVRAGAIGSFLNVYGSAITRELQRIAVEESHARIPLLFGFDVIHGFRTTFPIPLAEAASWDPGCVEASERIAAEEAAAAGIHWTFAPMVDIARDPRWGRIAEGSGEDPHLGSVMAAARVRGFQGKSFADASTIVACAKHFAAYGAAEGGRDYNTVEISERTLRDVYLPPFKAAVDAGAGTLMASFNEINGVPSSANRHLLTDILRKEWQFNGFVVSDWNSVGELRPHGIAANDAEAARLAINAGLDMDMESGFYGRHLASLMREGKISPATIDEAVRRILRVKFSLGLFDDPYRNCSAETEARVLRDTSHAAAARDMARRSIVLLKNEGGLLPLKKNLPTVAVIGPLADNNEDPLGPWAQVGEPRNVVTLLQGIRSAVAPGTRVLYAQGCTINGMDTAGIAAAVAIAREADVVLLAVGESASMSGEASSRALLDLPGRQKDLVRAVRATGRPIALVLMNGRPLTIPEETAMVPAVLETWFLGHQTGNAIADILFGDHAPSGRLAVTFPRTVGQSPMHYNHKATGRPANDSVRFSSRYLDVPSTPLFPFGYGLTYTTFRFSDLQVASGMLGMDDTLTASVVVANTGSRAGDEVVQLYVRDDYGSVTRPVKELKAFERAHLGPGQLSTVHFALPVSRLAFTTMDMRQAVEPGSFRLFIGPNAAEGLETSFTVADRRRSP